MDSLIELVYGGQGQNSLFLIRALCLIIPEYSVLASSEGCLPEVCPVLCSLP